MTSDQRILRNPATGVTVDLQMTTPTDAVTFGPALAAMAALEGGAMANPEEERQVGHYWLRDPSLAPHAEIQTAIRESWAAIEALDVTGFDTVLQVGIGGSALGPELAIDALAQRGARQFHILDTVDPSGIRRILDEIDLKRTVVIVASKSGNTLETRAATRIVESAFAVSGLTFEDHAVAITSPGSPLAKHAEGWRATLPVWSWVGGRTSITSAVGLLPMYLCGIDIHAFLEGARQMDAWTRSPAEDNPAAQLAALWANSANHTASILPYCEGLRLLGRYLQQLVMESLGKASSRSGEPRNFGLTVLGNKGSADQHALVQQLREGPHGVINHFVHVGHSHETDPLFRDASDLQFSLMLGTQHALAEVNQPVISIGVPALDARNLGAIIALFERTVGLTAELLDINAYNQPGVESGKREARFQLDVLHTLQSALTAVPTTSGELATKMELEPAMVWRLCNHLTQTGRAAITRGKSASEDRFRAVENSAK